jgi:cyanate lyase
MEQLDAISAIMRAKEDKGITWSELAGKVGKSEVWVTASLLGQGTFSKEEAEKLSSVLELDNEVEKFLTRIPYRGDQLSTPPTDPLLYRLYEMIMVFGPATKELIHEKFGDGIMSAIDFEMDIEKKPDPKGDRVVITLDGKFLPYKTW